MEKASFIYNLNTAFRQNGYGDLLNESKSERLWRLAEMLVETNKITNLTAITDEHGIVLKHFLDSATVAPLLPVGSKVIDIGCGAGFPSLPLAILREDLSLVALDSTGKKIDFVNAVARDLTLDNISGVCGRAEEVVIDYREHFDVAVSRAVARLNILAELSLPFVKIGGCFAPMKAANKGNEEFSEAKAGIKTLGAELLTLKVVTLSHMDRSIDREIYLFSKTAHTPKQYPRKYAQILKKPL